MVIHQFNRIIRNKWIWGVFAVAISAFFAFDFLLTGGDTRENRVSAGELNGEDIAEVAKRFGISRNLVSQIKIRVDRRIVAAGREMVENTGF